jgi:hopanoid C-3 methylase
VAINIIADPSWDHERFRVIRDWCMEIPEIVNISVNTPYPGTESWRTESRKLSTRDYRLFDIQHAVLPTKLTLAEFYQERVETQRVLSMKHLGFAALRETAGLAAARLLRGQTNFVQMLWKFNSVDNPKLQHADHYQPIKYEISLPPPRSEQLDRQSMYIHSARGRGGREIDHATEQFVESTRMGASQ